MKPENKLTTKAQTCHAVAIALASVNKQETIGKFEGRQGC